MQLINTLGLAALLLITTLATPVPQDQSQARAYDPSDPSTWPVNTDNLDLAPIPTPTTYFLTTRSLSKSKSISASNSTSNSLSPREIKPHIDTKPGYKSECGNSTFEDTTSSTSPSIHDCLVLCSNITPNGRPLYNAMWEIENILKKQHQIAQYGTCAFGVQGNKKGDLHFNVGNADIIDVVHDAVQRFGRDGRIGARGHMVCAADFFPPNITWGIYRNPEGPKLMI